MANAEEKAKTRQADIDARRPIAEALSEADYLHDHDAWVAAITKRLASDGGITPDLRRRLADAINDDNKMAALLKDLETEPGLQRTGGRSGDVVKFDRLTMEGPPGLKEGQQVDVLTPGYRMQLPGDDTPVTLHKARVTLASAERAAA